MEPLEACRLQALACSEALACDASIPRPGLSAATYPRRNPDPSSIIASAARAYELCLHSCLSALTGDVGRWVGLWAAAVEDLLRRGWGNPSMGSLFLLALHSAALGRAMASRGLDSEEHVMGAAMEAVEATGVDGALEFYRVLRLVSPSYLGRLSWNGLPDAATPLAASEVLEKEITLRELLWKASMYDPVARDASRGFELSFGLALPELEAHACSLAEALRRATLLLLALEGDFLVKRKLSLEPRSLAVEAYRGSAAAEAQLWRLLKAQGPGSVADVTVNALARLLYKAEKGVAKAGFTGC